MPSFRNNDTGTNKTIAISNMALREPMEGGSFESSVPTMVSRPLRFEKVALEYYIHYL